MHPAESGARLVHSPFFVSHVNAAFTKVIVGASAACGPPAVNIAALRGVVPPRCSPYHLPNLRATKGLGRKLPLLKFSAPS